MKAGCLFYACLIFIISSSRARSEVPKTSVADEGIGNSELNKYSTLDGIESAEQFKALHARAPIRAKREGFVDFSAIPQMMAGMFGSLGKGISSMIGYSQSFGHQMVQNFAPSTSYSTPHPTSYRETVQRPSYGAPNLSYGSWKPLHNSGNSYKPPKPSPSYSTVIHPKPTQYVPAKPSYSPLPPPKPVYVRPQPTYVQSKPIITYKPSTSPPVSQDSYGTPVAKPISHSSSDSYGSPVGQVLGKPSPVPSVSSINHSQPPRQPTVSISTFENPFTTPSPSSPNYNQLPPFQTNFEPGPSPISNFNPPTHTPGSPLIGTFESQSSDVNSVEIIKQPLDGHDVVTVEEYSDDTNHVKEILKHTLYYKDTKKIKFKQKDDGKPHDKDEVIALGKFDFPASTSSSSIPEGGGSPHVLPNLLPNRLRKRKINQKKKNSILRHLLFTL